MRFVPVRKFPVLTHGLDEVLVCPIADLKQAKKLGIEARTEMGRPQLSLLMGGINTTYKGIYWLLPSYRKPIRSS